MGQFLGQHFLKNTAVISKIIDALSLERGDIVIEIGPGRGALTLPLAKRCKDVSSRIVAIEKDPNLIPELQTKLKNLPVQIIEGDALHELPRVIARSRWGDLPAGRQAKQSHQHDEIASPGNTRLAMTPHIKIVGNIPYYITGQLLRVISDLQLRPSRIVLMVQKEVAERVAAIPPRMNLLAAAVQVWADVSIIARLRPHDFDPPPEVSSAVIVLNTKTLLALPASLASYYRFIHRAFAHPRKTLLNNLVAKKQASKDVVFSTLQKLGYTEKTRAQELSIDQLLTLSKKF